MYTAYMSTKTAILYTRVSSAGQIDGTSLASQEADLRAYCAKNNYEILAHFQDAGESAKTTDRPGLIEALAFAKKHKPSAFVVHKLDRLSRNTADGLTIRTRLRAHQTELISATEAITADPVGDMVSTILLSVAQFDNQIRASRCKRGMHEIAKKGGWTHKAPVGYLNARRECDGLSILIPDPLKASAIASILKGLASGSSTLAAAYTALKNIGFSKTAAGATLRNPIYAGIICNTETDFREIKAGFNGLITPREFTQIQQRLGGFGKKRQTENPATPLRGLLFCEHCGTPLTSGMATGRGGKKHESYWCHKCDQGGKVSGKSAQTQIAKLVSESDFLGDLLAAVMFEFKRQTSKIVAEHQRRRDEAIREIKVNERRLEKLSSGWMDGLIDDAFFREKSAAIRLKIGELSAITEEKSDLTANTIARLESLGRILLNPGKVFELIQIEQQKLFIEKVFGGFTVSPEKRLNYLNSNSASVYNILMRKNEAKEKIGAKDGI